MAIVMDSVGITNKGDGRSPGRVTGWTTNPNDKMGQIGRTQDYFH